MIWLEQTLAPYRQHLGPATEALILWAWQHRQARQALALALGDGFPAHLHATVRAFWTALSFFHRSSSLAEALHSWLRPYLALHRGMPAWLLPLLQLVWNHHPFSRGKRAGSTPLQLAGGTDAPTLAQALDLLGTAQPGGVSQPARHYTLAEVFGLSRDEQAVLQFTSIRKVPESVNLSVSANEPSRLFYTKFSGRVVSPIIGTVGYCATTY